MFAKIENNKIVIQDTVDKKLVYHLKLIRGNEYIGLFGEWTFPVSNKNINSLHKLGIDIVGAENDMKATWDDIKNMFPFCYDYQIDAILKTVVNGNLLIADDLGLGKTIESLASAVYQYKTGKVKKIIVCCEKSIKEQWQESIKNFFKMDSTIIDGDKNKRQMLYEIAADVIIINYEQIVNDFYSIAPLMRGGVVIYDEASLLKNDKTKRSKAVMLLNPLYKIALTGTPVENRLEDVFNICKVIDDKWMELWEFKKNHINYQRNDEGYMEKVGYKNIPLFLERLQDIAIRRKQSEVKGFPGMVIYDRIIELSLEQKRLAKALVTDVENPPMGYFTLFAMLEDSTELIKLSEAKSINASNINKDKIKIVSPKLHELETIVDEISDDKIVIFTRFKNMAMIIQDRLGESAIIAYGDTDKAKVIRDFRDRDEIRFLVSTDVFARGVDIPFGTCVINFDILWNPAKLRQRINRCHRVTSKQQVKVFNLIAGEGSIESYMYEVMGKKKALFDSVTNFNKSKQLLSFFKKQQNLPITI